MLDHEIKSQLQSYLDLLESKVTIQFSKDNSKNAQEMNMFLEEVVALSDLLQIEEVKFCAYAT